MRRPIILATAAAAALVVSGIAIATLRSTGTEQVSATFSAPTVVRSNTHTCTGADGTYEFTHAVYSGIATSANDALAGPIEIRVVSVYNTTEKLGWVDGWYRVHNDDRRLHGRFSAVNTNGTLDGFLNGRVNMRYANLLGGFTAGYTRDGGFTSGQLGTGSATNAALLVGRPCVPRADSAVRLLVRGQVESLSSSSISVKPNDGSATQTCAITPKSPSTNGVAAGDKVEMGCATLDGTMTLVKLHKRS